MLSQCSYLLLEIGLAALSYQGPSPMGLPTGRGSLHCARTTTQAKALTACTHSLALA